MAYLYSLSMNRKF